MPDSNPSPTADRLRIDKWLWAARFYKTRGLATEEVSKGRVQLNGVDCKPSREVKVGDLLQIRRHEQHMCVEVVGICATRGSAPVAQALYRETPASIAGRLQAAEQRRIAPEPAHSYTDGRPTKRNRRALQTQALHSEDSNNGPPYDWNARWSASVDD
jgi:ribosome-associated heat shock protein Hsp15